MISTGTQFREAREVLGISQSRFSELLGLKQHVLSSFELEKSSLPKGELLRINRLLSELKSDNKSARRKKRYRAHTYARPKLDPARAQKHVRSPGNEHYLSALANLEHIPRATHKALSLFSGIGGFSLGFRHVGFEIKGFVEIDDGLARIYEKNFATTPRIGSDITRLTSKDLRAFTNGSGDIDVVIGGPPCQGFSLSGRRRVDDPRNYLFEHYLRVIKKVQPRIAVLENVKLLSSMRSKQGGYVKDSMMEGFVKQGYRVKNFEINAKDYGVPQHRERIFFVAVRNDLAINPSFPLPTFTAQNDLLSDTETFRTFADACSDLPYIESGQTSNDLHHRAVKHPDHIIEWLWDVPEGGSAHDNLDPAMRPPSGYNTTYKRQIWIQPSATVQTTFGMISGCRNVHPVATRSLTVREAARLQSFPDRFALLGSLSTIRTGIGNAVPPLLAQSIANHLRSLLRDFVEISSH